MSATKTSVELELSLRKAVGYSYYKSNVSLIQRLYIKANSPEPLQNVEVKIESQPEFLLPFSKTIPQLPSGQHGRSGHFRPADTVPLFPV